MLDTIPGAFIIRVFFTTVKKTRDSYFCQFFINPKGVEHRTISTQISTVLLIEPISTVNTGDTGGALTDNSLEWI
jgi:hypothetical protein